MASRSAFIFAADDPGRAIARRARRLGRNACVSRPRASCSTDVIAGPDHTFHAALVAPITTGSDHPRGDSLSAKQSKKKWLEPQQVATSADAMGRLVRGAPCPRSTACGLAILLVLAHAFDVIQTRGGPRPPARHLARSRLDRRAAVLRAVRLLDHRNPASTRATRRTTSASSGSAACWRIFPLYYGVLALALCRDVYLWTYTSNYAAPFGHVDSVVPALLVARGRGAVLSGLADRRLAGRAARRDRAAAALVPIAIACRVLVRARWGDGAAYMFTPCRMDALAIGAAAAALVRGDRLRA